MTANASWDDDFELPPTSDPADIFKITAWINAGPISYDADDFCDAHYIGNPVCTEQATLSAESLFLD